MTRLAGGRFHYDGGAPMIPTHPDDVMLGAEGPPGRRSLASRIYMEALDVLRDILRLVRMLMYCVWGALVAVLFIMLFIVLPPALFVIALRTVLWLCDCADPMPWPWGR